MTTPTAFAPKPRSPASAASPLSLLHPARPQDTASIAEVTDPPTAPSTIAVIVRLRYYARTRAYVQRRTAEGRTKLEIIRCLKRYLAREIYRTLRSDYQALTSPI